MNDYLSDLFFNFYQPLAWNEKEQAYVRENIEENAANMLDILASLNVPNLPTQKELADDFFSRI